MAESFSHVSRIGALRPLEKKIRRSSKCHPLVGDAWRASLFTLDILRGTEVVLVVVVRSLSVIWILQPKFLICVRSCADLL